MHAFRRQSGFTLMELMIVLAIVAILLGVAIPAYTSQMQRSRRSDAIASLQDIQLQQERYRADNPTYATAVQLTAAGTTLPTSPYYTFTIANPTATGYTLTATPGPVQARDCQGAALTLTVVRGVTTKAPADCW